MDCIAKTPKQQICNKKDFQKLLERAYSLLDSLKNPPQKDDDKEIERRASLRRFVIFIGAMRGTDPILDLVL
jgi:hypothetical protein